MVNYENSKIYKIEPIIDHEDGDIYIGSTTKQFLSQRMDSHRSAYKLWKLEKVSHIRSFDIFDKYGIENCQILLIDSYACQNKDELRRRENHYIRTIKCVNKNKPIRTKEEYIQYQKLYRETNKESLYIKKKDKFICKCGSNYTRVNYAQHCKSKKHQLYLNSQNDQIIVEDV